MSTAEFLHKTTGYHAPVHERSLLWNDLDAGVSWPMHGDRDRRFRLIVTGRAACSVGRSNCRGSGHDGSGLISFLRSICLLL